MYESTFNKRVHSVVFAQTDVRHPRVVHNILITWVGCSPHILCNVDVK